VRRIKGEKATSMESGTPSRMETPKPTIVSMPVTRVYSQMRWMLRTYCTRIALGGGMM